MKKGQFTDFTEIGLMLLFLVLGALVVLLVSNIFFTTSDNESRLDAQDYASKRQALYFLQSPVVYQDYEYTVIELLPYAKTDVAVNELLQNVVNTAFPGQKSVEIKLGGEIIASYDIRQAFGEELEKIPNKLAFAMIIPASNMQSYKVIIT